MTKVFKKDVLGISKDSATNSGIDPSINPKELMGQQKDPVSLVPTEIIKIASRVGRYGAYEAKRKDGGKGYGPMNWRDTKVSLTTYLSANMRHLMAIIDGEDIDPDSGEPHIGHITFNCGIIADAQKHGTLVDDRPCIKDNRKKDIRLGTEESKKFIDTLADIETVTAHIFPDSVACETGQCRCNSINVTPRS